MDLGLTGKVVFLTGGSGGIGSETARLFAAEGARVALTYHRNQEAAQKVAAGIEQQGGSALVVPYDLTDRASIEAGVDAVVAEWGGIDALVVGASPSDGPSPDPVGFHEIPPETWTPQLRAEVEGAFHTVQAVLPAMRARGGGRMVFLSASVVNRGFRGEEAYVAGKMALHGLSRTLATELAGDGILTNVVAPGPTVTDKLLVSKLPPEVSRSLLGKRPEELKEILNERMPHLRFSTPLDVANAIVFLASPANGNISGAVVGVAGGH